MEGAAAVTFAVPRLNLLGGDYDVAVGAHDQDAPAAACSTGSRASPWPTLRTARASPTCAATWSPVGRREVVR